jgi:hypothetical protein
MNLLFSGHRTIGVITKLDIMDRGTDARNHLLGKTIPLRLGYVGVVNRSQEDILMNRSIKDALVAEEKFFRSRPVYSGLTDRLGVPQLAKKLNQVLSAVLRSSNFFVMIILLCSQDTSVIRNTLSGFSDVSLIETINWLLYVTFMFLISFSRRS